MATSMTTAGSTHGKASEMSDILLESGTNELEVLVFRVDETSYGVNVAKVREVIGQVEITKVPMMHAAMAGVFKLRDSTIPLVDLHLYFQPGCPSSVELRNVIFMEFNGMRIGFLVDRVERIFRVSWDTVEPMPLVDASANNVITSVCRLDERLVLMVDFEKIAFDVGGRGAFGESVDQAEGEGIDRGSHCILLAEDSPTIRGMIEQTLTRAGYGKIVASGDGAAAWDQLERQRRGELSQPFTIVITDIEMPQMDGLHLCRRIKEDSVLKALPVVVFSSLVSKSNLKKCQSVGADAAITKPQISRVVELVDRLLERYALSAFGVEDFMTLEDEPAESAPA